MCLRFQNIPDALTTCIGEIWCHNGGGEMMAASIIGPGADRIQEN